MVGRTLAQYRIDERLGGGTTRFLRVPGGPQAGLGGLPARVRARCSRLMIWA